MKKIWIIGLAGLLVATTAWGQRQKPGNDVDFQQTKFVQFYRYLSGSYIDTLDNAKLMEAAINKILSSLDPHSYYVSPEEMVEVRESFDGKFSGIGVQINMMYDTIRVSGVISGGPSEKVGMLPGDRIVRVDTTSIVGINQTEAVKLMRGTKGSKVAIGVVRPGSGPLTFRIVRDDIAIETVDAAYMPEHGVGYIKVNRFAQTTMTEFREAFRNFGKPEAMIVDLRSNGGGLLMQAIEMANFFLPQNSLILSTQGRAVPDQKYTAPDKIEFKGKLIVLIDDFSASASEIVAGAIQDWDRGIIIGRRSFGKGLVQKQFPLIDGSAVNITVSRYLTPSGRAIQRPFEKGHEDDYQNDFVARFSDGYVDTLNHNDTLRYRTLRLKREVFGGGGIYPDYYVEADTTGYSDYMGELIRKGVLFEYSNEYIDKHRAEMQQAYPDYAAFTQQYSVTDKMLENLATLGELRGVKRDPAGMEEARDRISRNLKAYAARALWGETELNRVLNESDPVVLKALETLRNWREKSMGAGTGGGSGGKAPASR